MDATSYETLEQLEAKEKDVYNKLPTRIKQEIDEYFYLCGLYDKRIFTWDEVKRFRDLTLLAHKYDLSPLCQA